MNIFIDSNILYEDYFFEKKSNNGLLNYSKLGVVNIFMSKVVLLELRHQLEKELEQTNKELNKLNKKLKRLGITQNKVNLVIEDELNKFDEFYKECERCNKIQLLEYKNEYLPYIVNKAIKKEKPFTENKSELKDAIIWKTYSDYVEIRNIENCILLTNNTTDFCKKNDKSVIHPILLEDTSKFNVINSSFLFIKKYSRILESPNLIFKTYAENLKIDNEYILSVVGEGYLDELLEKTQVYLDRSLDCSDFFDDLRIYNNELICDNLNLRSCDDLDYGILDDRILVDGKVKFSCDVELVDTSIALDDGHIVPVHVASTTAKFVVWFNLDIRENEEISELELTFIELLR